MSKDFHFHRSSVFGVCCPPVYPSVIPPVCPSVRLSVCPSALPSCCPSVLLSFCTSLHLLSIYPASHSPTSSPSCTILTISSCTMPCTMIYTNSHCLCFLSHLFLALLSFRPHILLSSPSHSLHPSPFPVPHHARSLPYLSVPCTIDMNPLHSIIAHSHCLRFPSHLLLSHSFF